MRPASSRWTAARTPVPDLRSYMGDPRGHWEGNTLVVETTNFIGGKVDVGGVPYSEDLKLMERFTRVDADTIDYKVTIDDPKTFTAPWTVEFPIRHEPGYQIFEYACHEGNHAMHNRLSAARALDRKDSGESRTGGPKMRAARTCLACLRRPLSCSGIGFAQTGTTPRPAAPGGRHLELHPRGERS